jgi:short-subunit dehydrogenase
MKTAIVTGGSRGIGKATVELFLSKGFNVIAVAKDAVRLEKMAYELKSQNLTVMAADLSNAGTVNQLSSKILRQVETIDVLVNNAGVFRQGEMLKEEDSVLADLLNTNVLSVYYLTKGLQSTFKTGTHIFTVCSIASLSGYADSGSYATTKFALLGLTKSLRKELIPQKVKVTAVLPGATLTDSWAGVNLPADRFIGAEDIAKAIGSAYEMGDSAVVEEILIRPLMGDI